MASKLADIAARLGLERARRSAWVAVVRRKGRDGTWQVIRRFTPYTREHPNGPDAPAAVADVMTTDD